MLGEQGWRSGESTCLPPMWPGFDSQTSIMWVEFVVGSHPYSKMLFSRYSGLIPCPQKPTFPDSTFDLESVPILKSRFDHLVMELCGIQIYLIIYLSSV